MYLGGGYTGERLNTLYKENVTEDDILSELGPMLEGYSKNKNPDEHFGDYCLRNSIV
jgi:sulfite reductase (NADPH) hemoprotein beta-component